jgi:hypothetical protein
MRRAVALLAPGLASLALVMYFLLSAEFENGTRTYRTPHFYVLANWGVLAMASVFAMVTCLGCGALLGTLLARLEQTLPDGRAAAVRRGGPVGTGIVAAAAIGIAVGGLYAVFGSLYFGVPVGALLRWALYPVLPVAVIAAVIAVVATRQRHRPRQGWDAFLAFPLTCVGCGAVGTALVHHSMITPVRREWELWLGLTGRVGGLLIGVAVAAALVDALVLRLVAAAPLGVFFAAVTSWQATGIMAAMFAMAVAWWWARRLWTLTRSPVAPAAVVPAARSAL